MIVWIKWIVFLWLIISPLHQINLLPVQGSGIFLTVAWLVVIVFLIAVEVQRRPGLAPTRSRLTVPLVSLGIAAIIAGLQGALFYDRSVLGQHRYVAVQIYAVGLILLSIAAAFTMATVLRSTDDVRQLRRVLVLGTVLLVVRASLDLPLDSSNWWELQSGHTIALVAASLLYEKQSRVWNYPLGIALIATVIIEVVLLPFLVAGGTQWLSGWIVVSVPIALLVFARFPRLALQIGLPAAILFFYWQWSHVVMVYKLSLREGDFGRLLLWQDALTLTFQRPLFGIGPGNYLDYIYRYGQLGLMLSSPHGNYQQIAAETGLVGLGLAVWLFVRALGLALKIYRRTADPFTRSVSIAAACSLAGQLTAALLGDFLLPSYHNSGYTNIASTVYSWVMMGVLMTLERLEGLAPIPHATPRTERDDQDDQYPLQAHG